MSISVICPGCDKKYRVKGEMAGKRIKCRACSQVVTIPGELRSGTNTASLAPKKSTRAGTPKSRKSAPSYLVGLIGGGVFLGLVVGIVLLLNRSDKTSVPNTVANTQSTSLVQSEPATDAVEAEEKGFTDAAVTIESRADANSIADTPSSALSEERVPSVQAEQPAPLIAAKSTFPEPPKLEHTTETPAVETDAQSETGVANNEAVPIQWPQFEEALKLLGICNHFQLVGRSAGSVVTAEEVAVIRGDGEVVTYLRTTLYKKPLSSSLHSAMTYLESISPKGCLQYVIVEGSETSAISAVKMILGEERSKEVRGDLSLRNDGTVNMEAEPAKIVWYDYGRLRFGVLNGDVVGVFAELDGENAENPSPLFPADFAQPELPALGPPPTLPATPGNLEWAEETKKKLDTVMANYAGDQVSAYLTLNEILNRKLEDKDRPTDTQRAWLEKAVVAVQPRAIDVLRRDFAAAVASRDLRGALIALSVAEKVRKDGLPEAKAALPRLKSDLFSGKPIDRPIWKIHEPKATWLKEAYTEGDFTQQFTLTPDAGFHLLRVTTRVENISSDSDPSYTLWSLSDFKKVIHGVGFAEVGEDLSKPHRMTLDEHFFLLTPGGDLISCIHVCKDCTKLRGLSYTVSGKDGKASFMIFTGGEVIQGSDFLVDVIFSVPEGIEGLRLLILGGLPVPMTIEQPDEVK